MANPVNSGSLPSNNSFSVSTNRLLPKRRGRDKEVMFPSVHQPPGVGRLVHVVVAFLAELPEGLDADGQLAFGRAGGARHRGATITPVFPGRSKDRSAESEERSCSFPLPSLRPFDPSTSSGHRRLKAPQAQGPESGLEPAPDLIRGRGDPNQPTISSRAAPRPLTAGGRRTQHRGLRRLLRGHARRGVAAGGGQRGEAPQQRLDGAGSLGNLSGAGREADGQGEDEVEVTIAGQASRHGSGLVLRGKARRPPFVAPAKAGA